MLWLLAGVGCWSGRWKWLNPVVCTCKGRGPRFACQTLGSVVGSKQSGIFVHTRGVLTCENDNIFQNAKAGVQVKNTGQVFATKNVIRKNGHVGIWIYEGGNGSLIHNDLRFNERGGLKLEKDAGSVRLGQVQLANVLKG